MVVVGVESSGGGVEVVTMRLDQKSPEPPSRHGNTTSLITSIYLYIYIAASLRYSNLDYLMNI